MRAYHKDCFLSDVESSVLDPNTRIHMGISLRDLHIWAESGKVHNEQAMEPSPEEVMHEKRILSPYSVTERERVIPPRGVVGRSPYMVIVYASSVRQ